MQTFIPIFSAVLGAVFFTSCATHTPQSRIAENPSLYTKLPAKHQEKVSVGDIQRGMSKSAVYLALGNPDRKSIGETNKGNFERWDYVRLVPVHRNRFHGGFGYGRGFRGHRGFGSHRGFRGRGFHHGGFGTGIDYVPRRSASVYFRNDKVERWDRYRR